MNWIRRDEREPTEPFMALGWSNHILLYCEKEDCWFEGVYNFRNKKFYTLDHIDLDTDVLGISHFCEEIPLPNNRKELPNDK